MRLNMSNEKKSTQEGKYEDIVTVGFVNPIVNTGIDYAEMGIDAFMTNDVIKEIPIIKTIASVVKVCLSIKEWTFAKKIIKFLEQYHLGYLTENEKEAFLNKYQSDTKYKEKIVSFLITINDKYFETKQSEIAGNLFVAYVKGLIDWDTYTIICGCIDRFSPFASELLNELEKEKEPYHRGYQHGTDPRAAVLQSCAFGYQWGTHFFTTPIGIIAHQYGIKADFNHSVKELYQIAGFNTSNLDCQK